VPSALILRVTWAPLELRTTLLCRHAPHPAAPPPRPLPAPIQKVPFGYTRADVLIIGVGTTAAGFLMYYGLQASGVSAIWAGNIVQLTFVGGLTAGGRLRGPHSTHTHARAHAHTRTHTHTHTHYPTTLSAPRSSTQAPLCVPLSAYNS